MTVKTEISLPFFGGFYETILSGCLDYYIESEIDYQETECDRVVKWDDFTYDWSKVKNALASAYVDAFNEEMQDDDIISNVEFDCVISPREYNFTTDSLFVKCEINERELLGYCNNNLVAFEQYLIDNFKSREGFISFYSHDVEDWLVEDYVKDKNQEIYYSYLIDFYVTNSIEDIDYKLSYVVWERGYEILMDLVTLDA
ncbi:MAG: hypothetical protein E6R13_05735 [Spirochaetes bacterium]|nr:MAG: hypothetical protein E6R13_05735 [Spirochaetota bacterium]